MTVKDIREKSNNELVKRHRSSKEELFTLRFQKPLGKALHWKNERDP